MHEWMVDCGYTPHLIVDALPEGVGVSAAGGVRTLEGVQAMIGAGAARVGTSSAVLVMLELAALNGNA